MAKFASQELASIVPSADSKADSESEPEPEPDPDPLSGGVVPVSSLGESLEDFWLHNDNFKQKI